MVTKMAIMPAVLVELGFLTNPTEEDFLNSEKGQAYMASAIFRAFREYKAERENLGIQSKPAPSPATPPEQLQPKTPRSIEEGTTTAQNKENTKNQEPEVFYSVQITTSIDKKELVPENFHGLEGVEYYVDGGLYKYIVGRATDLKSADALKQKMRTSGFQDAFVVALADGKRISLSEAQKLLE